MWTCDIIEALKALEEKMGYPTCISDIGLDLFGKYVRIQTTSGRVAFYDTDKKVLTFKD